MDSMLNNPGDGTFPSLRKPAASTKSALVAQAREKHRHNRQVEGFSKEHTTTMAELRREQRRLSKSLESLLTRQQAIRDSSKSPPCGQNGNSNAAETNANSSSRFTRQTVQSSRWRQSNSLDMEQNATHTRRLSRQLSCRSESGSPILSCSVNASYTRPQSSSNEEKNWLHPWTPYTNYSSSPDCASFRCGLKNAGPCSRESSSSGQESLSSGGHESVSSPDPSPPTSPRQTTQKRRRKLYRSVSDAQAPPEHFRQRTHSEGARTFPVSSRPGAAHKKVSSVPKLPDVQKTTSLPSSPQLPRQDMCLLVPKKRTIKGKLQCYSGEVEAGDDDFCSISDGNVTCYRLPRRGRTKIKQRETRKLSIADGLPQIVTSIDNSKETDEFWYLRYVLDYSPTEA